MTPNVAPKFGSICHRGHRMEAQRDGDLWEINPDQSVEETEDGALVSYEYVGCADDCQDIPEEITDMAFEIIFNGVTCDCPADDDHVESCELY